MWVIVTKMEYLWTIGPSKFETTCIGDEGGPAIAQIVTKDAHHSYLIGIASDIPKYSISQIRPDEIDLLSTIWNCNEYYYSFLDKYAYPLIIYYLG